MTNYTIIQNNIITDIRISDGAYRLYTVLESMAYGDKITCYPSEKYLATVIGKSVRTVQRYLKELEKNGYIVKKRRGSISNLYYLIKKKIQQGIDKVKQAVKGNKNTFTESDRNRKNKQNNYYNNKNYYNKIKKDNFNNYRQRNYNYDNLEKILLGQEKYDPDLLK